MTQKILRMRIGPDGMLNLSVPVGEAFANQDVIVTVDVQPNKPLDEKAWHAFIEATAGKWQGEFERPEPGDSKIREELP